MNRTLRSMAVVLALASCAPAGAPDRGAVLVVVDTLRADHVSCYGYARETSPAIDRLAAGGVRFERAYSASSWTTPSVASILTGRHPSSHGIAGFEALDADVPRAATLLSGEGFATAAVVSHGLIGARYGFDVGFGSFSESEALGHDHVSTAGVVSQAARHLERFGEGDEPFFLLVHLFDPHYEYRRHAGIGFAAARAGELTGSEKYKQLRARLDRFTPEEVAFLRDLYDEEIVHTDAGIGRLLGTLERLGLDASTHVVFTADHGEEFLEHGWLGHVRHLYDHTVRVPLVLSGPGLPTGRSVRHAVSTVSVLPTLLELMDVDASEVEFEAPSLLGTLEPDHVAQPVFFEVHMLRAKELLSATRRGVVRGSHKLIQDTREPDRIELYDTERDPGEREDLADARPELVSELLGLLEAHHARLATSSFSGEVLDLDAEERARLEQLGYLEGEER